MREDGVRQIFVRVRAQRAAADSAVGLSNRKFGSPDDIDYESQVIQTCEQFLVPWIAGWLAAQADFEIRWLLDPPSAIAKMAREVLVALAPQFPAFEQYLSMNIAEVTANLVTGDEDAWRKQISPRDQDRLWNAMPVAVCGTLCDRAGNIRVLKEVIDTSAARRRGGQTTSRVSYRRLLRNKKLRHTVLIMA